MSIAAFKAASKSAPYGYSAEQAVIVTCIAQPERIGEIAARLQPTDFTGEFHRRLFSILVGLHTEGRRPSVEAIIAVTGDDEVAPNVSVRDYLKGLVSDRLYSLTLP